MVMLGPADTQAQPKHQPGQKPRHIRRHISRDIRGSIRRTIRGKIARLVHKRPVHRSPIYARPVHQSPGHKSPGHKSRPPRPSFGPGVICVHMSKSKIHAPTITQACISRIDMANYFTKPTKNKHLAKPQTAKIKDIYCFFTNLRPCPSQCAPMGKCFINQALAPPRPKPLVSVNGK